MAKVKDLLVNGSSRFIGKIYASDQFISQVANGTAPFVVSSSTVVANLNADMTDGLHVHTGRNNEVNKIVRTDGSGYIQTGYINTNVGTENLAISRIFYEYNNDGYIRKMSPSSFFSVLENSGNDISITVAGQNRKLTVGYASNSDKLNGVHYQNILERSLSGYSFSGTATGWFRIAESILNDSDGITFLLFIQRAFYYKNNESYTFSISITYYGQINITQLSGHANDRLITKIRVDWTPSHKAYIDLYINASSTENSYSWYTVGCAKSYTEWTVNPTLLGTAYEFTTVNGCKSDKGFTGDLTGNAVSATKLETGRTLIIGNTGKSFDGTSNITWSLSEIGAASSIHYHDDRYSLLGHNHDGRYPKIYTFSIHNQSLKLGTFTSGQAGDFLTIRLYTGDGYNATGAGFRVINLYIRASNSYPTNGRYFEAYTESHYAGSLTFHIVENDKYNCEIWISPWNYSGNSFYEIISYTGITWTNTCSTGTIPTANTYQIPNKALVYTDYINTSIFPGLNKVGTVTSVTVEGSNGISGSGTITTSGTIILSNSGVRSITINENYIRVNTNGNNVDLTVPYATGAGNADTVDNKHASDFTYNIYGGDLDCNASGTHSAVYRFGGSPSNAFPNASWSNMFVIGNGSDTMTQIGAPYSVDELYFRRGTWYSDGGSIRTNTWKAILHSGNYTSYTVKKDGTGASGTWGINITGSAGSATFAYVLKPNTGGIHANDRGPAAYTDALYTGGWASSSLGYATTYGTFIDLSGYSTWYHRLAFNTNGVIEHFMGINTTTLSKVGNLAYTSDIPTSLPANGGNSDTVDSQHFSYSNDSNSPTYLWATNSNGYSFLAARGSISVNYANSAGSAGSVAWANVTGKSIGLVIINKNNGTSSVYSSINYTGCLTASASGSGGTRTITITNNSSKAVRIACSVSSVYPANSYEFGWAHFTSSPPTSISANSSATFNISFGYIHCQGNWAASDFIQRGSGGYSFSCIAYYED